MQRRKSVSVQPASSKENLAKGSLKKRSYSITPGEDVFKAHHKLVRPGTFPSLIITIVVVFLGPKKEYSEEFSSDKCGGPLR